MANLKEWMLEEAGGEEIEAVVIGRMGWAPAAAPTEYEISSGYEDYGAESVPNYDTLPNGVVLNWDQAAPLLDFDFDDGYGSPSCPAIYAWTATKVVAVSQYDGSTAPFSVPRAPIACWPRMPGG